MSELKPQSRELRDDGQRQDETETPAESGATRIHPLATFLVGLVIGLLIGYGGRPSATQPSTSNTPVPAGGIRSTDTAASNAASPTLMDTVIAQTRHFKGDPDAPVTIIEFSDFQ